MVRVHTLLLVVLTVLTVLTILAINSVLAFFVFVLFVSVFSVYVFAVFIVLLVFILVVHKQVVTVPTSEKSDCLISDGNQDSDLAEQEVEECPGITGQVTEHGRSQSDSIEAVAVVTTTSIRDICRPRLCQCRTGPWHVKLYFRQLISITGHTHQNTT